MSFRQKYYFLILIFIIFNTSFCFIALPFNTIFTKNDSASPVNDYTSQMLQNDICVNFSVGNPGQNITAVLKMEYYGFSIFNSSFITNLSTTYELLDDERSINCYLQIKPYTSRDYFYLPTFNSFNEFNKYISNEKNKNNNKDIIKREKAKFLIIKKEQGSRTKFNDMYEKFGIIGLKLNYKTFHPPEFTTTFDGIKDIKTHTFYLKFDDNRIDGFFNSNNTGYFIVGEELSDNENEKKNIRYTKAKERLDLINWDLSFTDIISKSKIDEIEYRPEYKHAELYVNFPYIFGPRFYAPFIKKEFFQELISEGVCDYINNIYGEEYTGYKCDGQSQLFLQNVETKFPDLIFEHRELDENFTLTGKDLFTHNMYNKSDPYLYFAIIFKNIPLTDQDHVMSWILGIPFLKKYTLSFNYDNKEIGYLKKTNTISHSSVSYKKIIIITVFIFSVILSFFLGMFTHKKISKKPRKSKANELDDSCDYIENSNKKSDANEEINSNLIN